MKIGEVARASGASLRSIRYYEKVGLIRSARAANGYREFPADTMLLVRRIARMIALGFSTAEIATFLPCIVDDPALVTACSAVAAAHRRKLAEIERQIADLETRRAKLLVTLKAAAGQEGPRQPEPIAHALEPNLPAPASRRPRVRGLLRRHGGVHARADADAAG
jgi:MerR family transcriptional regulator, copper efflux regulator